MAPRLTMDSGAIQNGRLSPTLPIRGAKGSQAQLIGVGNSRNNADHHSGDLSEDAELQRSERHSKITVVLLSQTSFQISDVPLLGVIHDLDRVPRPGGDDSTIVWMTCTLLQKRMIGIWLIKRHFVKPTNMKYEGSTDSHEHLRGFEQRMDPSRPSSSPLMASQTLWQSLADADAPTAISAMLGSGLFRRILVANSNTMFRNAFDALGFKDDVSKTHRPSVMGNARKMTMTKFVVLQDSTAYNVILGRKTTNDLSGVIYTKFLVMKYETTRELLRPYMGIEGLPKPATNSNLALRKKSREATGIFLADLDAKVEE
ncbi:hypothetical protein PIB30_054740 [Stylosanthes scabra]|uniref:Uncharacterized protein n=1 Tax=Stylosanthes scabra TaxID=79078 RepID=A0ABU6TIN2_9FABA|nr:hypothetical protein [Stylosanthes scabra]